MRLQNEIAVLPWAKGHQVPPEAGTWDDRSCIRASTGYLALRIPWFQTFGLWKCNRSPCAVLSCQLCGNFHYGNSRKLKSLARRTCMKVKKICVTYWECCEHLAHSIRWWMCRAVSATREGPEFCSLSQPTGSYEMSTWEGCHVLPVSLPLSSNGRQWDGLGVGDKPRFV